MTQNVYSERTRQEAKEIRKVIQKEERERRFMKNLPFTLAYVGVLVAVLTYAVIMDKQYDSMRETIVNDNSLPYSVRQRYMFPDEQLLNKVNKGVK